MALVITINGVEVDRVEYGSKIVKTLGQRAQFSARVSSPDDSWSPPIGAEIFVMIDGVRYFGGLIYSVVRGRFAGTKYRWHDLEAVGFEWIFDRRHVTPYTFNEVYASDAIQFIVDNWVNGLPASDNIRTDFIPVAQGPLIYDLGLGLNGTRESVTEAFNLIARRTGWRVWVDPDKQLRTVDPLAPVASAGGLYSGAPFPYENSNNFYADSLTVEETREQYANRIVAVFSDVVELVADTFDGSHATQPTDGVRREWTLSNAIVQGSSVYVDGVLQTHGSVGETGKQWYFSDGGQTVEQDAAETLLTSAQSVVFNYLRTSEKVVYVENSAEIAARAAAEGTSGIYGKFFSNIPVANFASLEAAAEAQLDQIDDKTLVFRWSGKGNYWIPVNPGDEITIKISTDIDVHAIFRVIEWTETEEGVRDCRLEAHTGPMLKDGAQTFAELGGENATLAVTAGGGGGDTGPAIPEYIPNA